MEEVEDECGVCGIWSSRKKGTEVGNLEEKEVWKMISLVSCFEL